MKDTHTERGRVHRQRHKQWEKQAPCGTPSQVSRVTPWAEGGTKPLSHPCCPTQGNLHVQCNPYQNTMDFLQRFGTNHLKICMESEKTSSSQGNIKKENQRQGHHNARFQVVLQSSDRQDSGVLAQFKKTYRSMEKKRESRNGPSTLWFTNI